MTGPLVSVVVPAYNNEQFIAETMRSVLDQSDVDLELIVADHSSTDGTWDQMQIFADDPRVRLLSTPAGGGAAANFNRVSREARGTLLKLLPGDDYLLPGSLARQASAFATDASVVMTASRRRLIDARGKTLVAAYGLKGVQGPMSGSAAVRHVVRSGSNVFGEPGSVLLRREILESVGFWDFSHPYLVDQATYVRVLLHGSFVPDRTPGAVFRLNLGQWSVALADEQFDQVADFHRSMHQLRPDIVRSQDVRIGNARAWLMAQQRRLTYRVLQRRMS